MQPRPEPPGDLGLLYERYASRLIEIALVQFGIPGIEAERLAHEVFLVSIRHITESNAEARLIAAMTVAAGRYKELHP
ncbi:MAG TPA: hypothetical protein VGF48_17205 [Thermoanaerobaculia bacterium]|jgi:hypothetical protein